MLVDTPTPPRQTGWGGETPPSVPPQGEPCKGARTANNSTPHQVVKRQLVYVAVGPPSAIETQSPGFVSPPSAIETQSPSFVYGHSSLGEESPRLRQELNDLLRESSQREAAQCQKVQAAAPSVPHPTPPYPTVPCHTLIPRHTQSYPPYPSYPTYPHTPPYPTIPLIPRRTPHLSQAAEAAAEAAAAQAVPRIPRHIPPYLIPLIPHHTPPYPSYPSYVVARCPLGPRLCDRSQPIRVPAPHAIRRSRLGRVCPANDDYALRGGGDSNRESA